MTATVPAERLISKPAGKPTRRLFDLLPSHLGALLYEAQRP